MKSYQYMTVKLSFSTRYVKLCFNELCLYYPDSAIMEGNILRVMYRIFIILYQLYPITVIIESKYIYNFKSNTVLMFFSNELFRMEDWIQTRWMLFIIFDSADFTLTHIIVMYGIQMTINKFVIFLWSLPEKFLMKNHTALSCTKYLLFIWPLRFIPLSLN